MNNLLLGVISVILILLFSAASCTTFRELVVKPIPAYLENDLFFPNSTPVLCSFP